jgi:TatD DNase family protein
MLKNEPKYIDVHCHVNFKAFDEDRGEVIDRALGADTWLINVGTQIDTSKKAVELAHQYGDGVYAIIGLHPIHTDASFHDEAELGEGGKEFTSRGEVLDKEIYEKLLRDPKTVAIGECGLDYFRLEPKSLEKQRKAFIEQIEIANKVGKPLMLHIRDAYADTLQILKEHAKVKVVVHFFAGSMADAKGFLELGFLLSFSGVVTYPPKKDGSGCDYVDIIKNVPLDMILTDTDSPYVAPVPYRGKRNEPVYVKEIVKKIAEIKDIPEEEVARAIIVNARKLFAI